MSHGHGHGASASAGGAHRRTLITVLVITSGVLLAEVMGAFLTGSLALMADAGHMFTDVAGIWLAVLAITFASRPATAARTYGYYRLEILAAVVNGVLLFGVALFILVQAWQRWFDPQEIKGGLMLAFACIGLVANAAGLLLLTKGSKESLNVKGAYLEVLGDTLGSIAVIIAAAVIWATGWTQADALASVLVALMILPRTWSLLREAVDVLLEAAPKGLDLADIRQHILRTPGVVAEHDLHVWTLTSGIPMLSVHAVIENAAIDKGDGGRILDELSACLLDEFGIAHCTIQIEPIGHSDHEHGAHA